VPHAPANTADARGVGLVLASALGFAGMALWAKQAYADGWAPEALVAVRFILVALAFWGIALARGAHLARPPRRVVAAALLLGLTAYALENHLYFAAVARIDAGLLALIMSVYPALVVAGAVALGRERPDARRVLALAFAIGGAMLVLAGGAGGGFDGIGALLALGSATAYATYLLAGDRLVGALDPFLLAALATTGAAVSLTGSALATGDLALPAAGTGAYTDLAGLVAVSSVLPLGALWLGIRRIGAPTAAIVASVEPAVTVTLAAVLLGEHLRDLQLAGGALVVGAVVVLNARRPSRGADSVPVDEPAADLPAAAPARAAAPEPAPC
jgi:drug/metabolite transporter (DMT)-like permease